MEVVGVVLVVLLPAGLGMAVWVMRMRETSSMYKKQRGKSPKGWN